jgi:hypothetical protein
MTHKSQCDGFAKCVSYHFFVAATAGVRLLRELNSLKAWKNRRSIFLTKLPHLQSSLSADIPQTYVMRIRLRSSRQTGIFFLTVIIHALTTSLKYFSKLQINIVPSLSNSHVSFSRFLPKESGKIITIIHIIEPEHRKFLTKFPEQVVHQTLGSTFVPEYPYKRHKIICILPFPFFGHNILCPYNFVVHKKRARDYAPLQMDLINQIPTTTSSSASF